MKLDRTSALNAEVAVDLFTFDRLRIVEAEIAGDLAADRDRADAPRAQIAPHPAERKRRADVLDIEVASAFEDFECDARGELDRRIAGSEDLRAILDAADLG